MISFELLLVTTERKAKWETKGLSKSDQSLPPLYMERIRSLPLLSPLYDRDGDGGGGGDLKQRDDPGGGDFFKDAQEEETAGMGSPSGASE